MMFYIKIIIVVKNNKQKKISLFGYLKNIRDKVKGNKIFLCV